VLPPGRRRATGHLLAIAATALAVGLAVPLTCWGAPSATLEVSLIPEQLGHGTTIDFGFHITGTQEAVPPPITRIALSYPAHFGVLTSGLGTASCTATVLELVGPIGCPSQSLMGYGTATGEIQTQEYVIEETANTAVFMGPFENGDITLQFFLDAVDPLSVERIFPGQLLPAPPPFGDALSITAPLIRSFPGGPDVSLVRFRSTIGPLGITYHDHLHHEFVPYHPNGILLPHRCPQGGFPFAASFTFAEGTTITADRKVSCPRRHPESKA
jgi:hypothetical protein